MYHVIGTGLTTVLLYSISYFFYRIGYYSLHFHRKLWNSLLALAFIITAFAGLFLALQTSYKWDIPVIKSVLKVHVESGIGVAFTGIIHLLWHLSYFIKIFSGEDAADQNQVANAIPAGEIRINLFMTGFISSSIQFLLMREMMNLSGGYELIAGVFLGSWLIASALGSAIAGKSALADIRKINFIFSLAPLISILLLFILTRIYLAAGETPSFLISMITTFLILLPFCLVSGFTFVKLINIARSGNNIAPGKSFAIETTGGVASGIFISVLTSGLLNTYQLIMVIIILSFSYTALTYYISAKKTKIIAKIMITIILSLIIIFNIDPFFRQIMLRSIKVTDTKDTPYGNITTGLYEEEESIYYNHRLLAYKDDITEREENIHYALLQSESPQKVIVISGFLTSHLTEIKKYPVKKVIFIETDPALAQSVVPRNTGYQGELLIENRDAFRYISHSDELVDAILLLTPPPSTLLLNRFYTVEFFKNAKKRMVADGIFMCSPGPGDIYINKESQRLYSSVYNSLIKVFKNVRPVAGNKMYFIASDKILTSSFCQLAAMKEIVNIWVGPDFLSDDLVEKRSEELITLMDRSTGNNRSSFPVASFHFQSFNFSKNIDEKGIAVMLMILAFAFPILSVRRRNMIMYFSASSLAGFEIIILLTLQIIVGNMYQLTGLIIAGVMSGLALGAGVEIRLLDSLSIRTKGMILTGFYLLTGLLYEQILHINSGIAAIVLMVLAGFLPAIFTGHLFRVLTMKSDPSGTPAQVYSADLAGSAFGFILVAGLLVPALGIRLSVILLALMIFAGFLFGTVRNNK